MVSNRHICRVLAALPLSTASGRDFLAGFSRYAREHCHWQIRILADPNDLTCPMLENAIREGLDGIVMSEGKDASVARMIETSDLSVTLLGQQGRWIRNRTKNISFVRNDDRDIGRFAAKYLLGLGRFRTFAFVPDWANSYWAQERAQGFADQISPTGIGVDVFSGGGANYDAAVRNRLVAWLKNLEKPVGIMAAADNIAAEVLSLCESNAIEVPKSVSVISVDNDELVCDFVHPPLTSILPDHEKIGETAARELARLMRSRTPPPARQLRSTEKRIVERESTRTVIPAAQLVNRIVQYVRENVSRGIDTQDVVRHFGVSRRLADLRLRQFQDTTVAGLIAQARMEEVARWLQTSKASCLKIARSCGFKNPKHLANAFRRRFGMSMTDYRRQCATKRPALSTP